MDIKIHTLRDGSTVVLADFRLPDQQILYIELPKGMERDADRIAYEITDHLRPHIRAAIEDTFALEDRERRRRKVAREPDEPPPLPVRMERAPPRGAARPGA